MEGSNWSESAIGVDVKDLLDLPGMGKCAHSTNTNANPNLTS